MNVLSLFDGMSCGMQALKQAGIKVDNYYASEIDKYAIQIAKKNHPEIRHLGNIEDWKNWDLPKIDMIIGGPPCQGFSIAGKGLDWKDPRSQLFFTAMDILHELKPKYFLFENVASMKKEIVKELDQYLAVESIMINSALVSAQNRKRNYWCNWDVEQPEDKGILLKDVIECGSNELNQRPRGNNKGGLRENKSPSMGAISWVDNVHVVDRDKAHCIDANYHKGSNPKDYFKRKRRQLVFVDKSQTIPATIYKENPKSMVKRNKKGLLVSDGIEFRKLTPTECERLQALPDNYTEGVSNTQRYKMIGNGWTVSVIEHILRGMK
jgi:DNA-cytosine methyltransferase